MKTDYYPEVKLLLKNHSERTVEVLYDENTNRFKMPLIGSRPPYYAHPVYKSYYPII